MKEYFKYLILVSIISLSSFAQNSKIKWGLYGKKTVEERRATFPFRDAKKVALVAFPSPNMSVANSDTGETLKIDSLNLVRWHYKIIKSFELPEKEYKYFVTEIIELNQSSIDTLSNLLLKYKLKKDKLPREYNFLGWGCYEPRNAILFLDENNNVFNWIEVCFECYQFCQLSNETILNFNKFSGLNESFKMIDFIKEFFIANGIKYGVEDK